MNVEQIEYQLKQMRLPRMREEYERQRNDPDFQHMSFDERFSQMVSLEYDARINSTIETLIRKAEFYDSTASLADVNYKPERKLDQGLIEELGTNEYIHNHLNIIFSVTESNDLLRLDTVDIQIMLNAHYFAAVLGDHVHFSVTKNDDTLDPMEFLK